MRNNFKIKKLSVGVAACLAAAFSSQSFSVAIEAFNPQDRIATPADVPAKVWGSVDEYPNVFLLSDLDKVDMNQQVCFVSRMSSPQVPNVRDTRAALNMPVTNPLWSAPANVPEEVKQDPRLVLHASYSPVIESISGTDLYSHITEAALERDIKSIWRFSQRVIFDFAELYKVMEDKKSQNAWFEPFDIGKQQVEKQTTYYRVCGKKIAERVVRDANPYLMSFPSASTWQGTVPDSLKVSELEVHFVGAVTEADFAGMLATRNGSEANRKALGDRTLEKAERGFYDATDLADTVIDHKAGMYNGRNLTHIYLELEVLKSKIHGGVTQDDIDAKAEELRRAGKLN